MAIMGNVVGGSSALGKTLILEGKDGTQIVGVITEQENVFNAKPSDIRIGKTAVVDSGIVEGTNTINYRTEMSSILVLPGENFSIPFKYYNMYDYKKFQCIVVLFHLNYTDNVETMAITINDTVFSVEESKKLSSITKNFDNKSIDLNFTNNSNNTYEVFYFTFHEEEE